MCSEFDFNNVLLVLHYYLLIACETVIYKLRLGNGNHKDTYKFQGSYTYFLNSHSNHCGVNGTILLIGNAIKCYGKCVSSAPQWFFKKKQNLDIPGNWSAADIDMDGILNDISNPPTKPMDQWDTDEVLNFILSEISVKFSEVDCNNHLERFQCISGYIFRTLTEENCKILSNSNYIGEVIFNAKEKYIRCHPTEYIGQENNNNNYFHQETTVNSSLLHHRAFGNELDAKPHKRPGRPKCKSISDKMGKRSEKLWEFLLHLLRDHKTCPNLIKWENFEEGTFRFVQSDKVARLWGNRKKNDNMTYEKFSRAMRYYYKSEVLLPVPGRRLVYKFGPQAKGWKSITPIDY